ncbi:MAG: tetratricopeptide repeat-containing serine protease family protein, partial [Nitrospirota bacterium]|nr:tetratricopeptide repeat-containing serine protease family protein [Nitrospirota bacterium]
VVARQKKAVVTVYVNDRNGKQVISESGFIVDQSGIIATTCSAITAWLKEVGHTLVVRTEEGRFYLMEDVFSCSYKNNLSLLKINAKDLPAVKLAVNYRPKQKEHIFVIRRPSGLEATISGSMIKNVIGKDDFIQISLPVTQGSSGSTVFNVKGEVIAVVVAPLKKKGTYRAVSVKHVANQLDNYRKGQQKKMKQKLATIDKESNISAREIKPDRMEERLEIKLDSAESYFFLGSSYDQSSMFKEAIEAYKQAIIMKPDYGDAYVNLGLDYERLGKYSEAIDAYTEAIKIKPDAQSTYNKLGTLYIVLGKYSLALHTFKKAVTLDPKNSATHYHLGIAYFLHGDKTAAFGEYLVLKELDAERAKNLFEVLY